MNDSSNNIIFEGITSVSAVINAAKKNESRREILRVYFDKNKIITAITKANTEITDELQVPLEAIEVIAEKIASDKHTKVHVEEIQDAIEKYLMFYCFFDVAKAFMLYREKRSMVRKSNTTDESILKLIRNENKEMNEENSNK